MSICYNTASAGLSALVQHDFCDRWQLSFHTFF